MGIQITVREVNQQVFREFKADAVKNGLTLGSALTLAMEKFRGELTKKKYLFTSLVIPTPWGKDMRRVSEKVDEILYG
ncbi:hypothetical protein HYX13_05430 [Candidatus Woesearchaeota archaeon]|nr:hypothetical protein [Candidatus Woesearchaeota archaeon]